MEVECLECLTNINVDGVEMYSVVECPECETEFEYDGHLIPIEEDDDE
jgi:DNA polymerase III alpha subunit (gram-positive type)